VLGQRINFSLGPITPDQFRILINEMGENTYGINSLSSLEAHVGPQCLPLDE